METDERVGEDEGSGMFVGQLNKFKFVFPKSFLLKSLPYSVNWLAQVCLSGCQLETS